MVNIKYNNTEQYTDWEITTNRFVAFLDIMGFKDLISKHSHEDVYAKLLLIRATINNIEKNVDTKDVIHISMFSDSIIIFSKDKKKTSATTFFNVLQIIIARCMYEVIPIKGAAAYGRITLDIDNSIFFGQPLVDAYLLEEELFYYGIVCHSSIDQFLKTLILQNKEDLDNLLVNIETPFKVKGKGDNEIKLNTRENYSINWIPQKDFYKTIFTDLPLNIEEFYSRFLTASDKVQQYVKNTIDMENKMLQYWTMRNTKGYYE